MTFDTRRAGVTIVLAVLFLVAASLATAADRGTTSCKLHFDLKGWSAFYTESRGTGRVVCSNGQQARVALVARGGGLSFGELDIENGTGRFSPVGDIGEIFGMYASGDGHAGVERDAWRAWAMTKGPVQLAISGRGKGINLGFAVSGFEIKRQ